MKKLMMATMVAGFLALPVIAQETIPVQPTNFNYNYFEIDYVDFDSGLDGFHFEGSYDIRQNINAIGSLGIFSEGSNDFMRISGGLAYHFGVGQAFDAPALNDMDLMLHAELEYANSEWSGWCNNNRCQYDDSELGIYTGVEVRYKLIPGIELYGDGSFRTTFNNDFILSGGVRLGITEDMQLTVGFELADDDLLQIGGRFNF